jgi:hypothetical protein
MYLIDLVHFKNNRHFFSIIIKFKYNWNGKKIIFAKI